MAAHRAGRRGVGYDINSEYVDIALERLELGYRRPFLEEEAGRAVREGKKAQRLARDALEDAGFEILRTNPRIGGLGIQFNFLVENRCGQKWYVDVSGAFTTVRPGLRRTDTLWKALGRAHVHFMAGDGTPLLVMTSNLPKRGSEGWKAFQAVGPESVFDAIEISSDGDRMRFLNYGDQEIPVPIEGFWTQRRIDGAFPG